MEIAKQISTIRQNMETHLGERVTLKANDGRRRIFVNQGTLERTYSSIFVIQLEDKSRRKVTYNYCDILTKTVQLVFI
jgi:uncharacterized protein Veg